jgi:hypothetical protein
MKVGKPWPHADGKLIYTDAAGFRSKKVPGFMDNDAQAE